MRLLVKILCVTSAVLITEFLLAQNNNDDTLQGGTQVIHKDFDPVIRTGRKISEKAVAEDSLPPAPEIHYSILRPVVKTHFVPEPIVPAKMNGEPLNALYRIYGKAGVGNYGNTAAEIFVHSLRSKLYLWGAHARHFGSWGQIKGAGPSDYSYNNLDLNGAKYYRKIVLSTDAGYSFNRVHYYGYNPVDYNFIKQDIEQDFSGIYASAGIKSYYKDSTKMNFTGKLRYDFLGDHYKSHEHRTGVNGNLIRYFNGELFTMDIHANYNHFSNISDTVNNVLVGIQPGFISGGNKWRMKAGLGIYADVQDINRFYFYPDASFRYNVAGNLIIPYFGICGEVQQNTYANFAEQNPFILPDVHLQNANTPWAVYGGVRGSVSSLLSFNLKGARTKVNNMPLFVNDTALLPLRTRFDVVYDTVIYTQLTAEFNYQRLEKIRISIRGDYFDYSTTNEMAPWHRSPLKISLTGHYNLYNKILLHATAFYNSGFMARSFDPNDGEYLGYDVYGKKLKGYADISLGVTYKYSNRISAFLNLNNVMGMSYQKWNGYPTQRFNLLGGVTFSCWGDK